MREIKFRVFNKETSQMEIGTHICFGNGKVEAPKGNILMQFTGLLDKNGREIYEGDIIEYTFYGNTPGIVKFNLPVIFHEGCFAIATVNEEPISLRDSIIVSNKANGIQVIGNIYQNPDSEKRIKKDMNESFAEYMKGLTKDERAQLAEKIGKMKLKGAERGVLWASKDASDNYNKALQDIISLLSQENLNWEKEIIFTGINNLSESILIFDADRKKLIIDLSSILSSSEKRIREKMTAICRKIYIDGADWSEWGIDDAEAGKEFDETLSTALSEETKK